MKKILFLLSIIVSLLINIVAYAVETIAYIPDNPQQALIMIHGYGQSGERMQHMATQLKELLPHTAFYFPTAPDDGPWGGYQWFNIPNFGTQMSEKALYDKMMKDAMKNLKPIHQLIDEIHLSQNMPYEKISVAGFSQGGLMALLTGLTNRHNLAKVTSFSGVPLLFTQDFSANNILSSPQILILQGDMDTVIPATSFQMTLDTLKNVNIEPELKIIKGMPHTINSNALGFFKEFMLE